MIMRRPAAVPSRPPRRTRQRVAGERRVPVWPLLLGLLLLAAVVGAFFLLDRDDGDDPAAAAGEPVALSGVGAYDPDGGDGEHDDEAGLATDGDPSTFWRTSTYRSQLSAFKSGVGLVVEAGGQPERFVVTTETPGFSAEIRAGSSPEGPFETVGASKLVGSSTTWELDETDAVYYVVWITELIGSAHINEVKAT
jgi:hypothetical protein